MHNIKIFAGNSNPELYSEICRYVNIQPGKAVVSEFSDGETRVEIEENIRGASVFIIQSTCSPANKYLMELLIMLDACRRASAQSITAVIPYYGYARQDRKVAPRHPITSRLVADMLKVAGATRAITMDLHSGQIQGFLDMPSDHLFARPVLLRHVRSNFHDLSNVVIVSPDAGGMERVRAFAKRLNCTMAMIDKRRDTPNVSEVMNVVGSVKGKVAILLDDMIDTAGTIVNGARALLDEGAIEVNAYSTHAVLSGPAIQRLLDSHLRRIIVTNTIPLGNKVEPLKGRLEVLSVARMLGEAIKRTLTGESVSTLFEYEDW